MLEHDFQEDFLYNIPESQHIPYTVTLKDGLCIFLFPDVGD